MTIAIDSLTVAIDDTGWSIEGDDLSPDVQAIRNRPIHVNDYLGVGTPSWKL